MEESRLPEFNSIDDLVEFFDTNDFGEYDLPDADFDVDIKKRTFLVAVDKSLMVKLGKVARAQHISTGELVNSWLEEKAVQAA